MLHSSTISNLLACVKDAKYNFKKISQYKYIHIYTLYKYKFPCYGQPQDLLIFQVETCSRIVKKDVEKLNKVNCEYNVDLEVFV